jgi:2-polyprenyl-3-methyl-5-hydroxy-6-metoxy-1,4-benzoquinol methylase
LGTTWNPDIVERYLALSDESRLAILHPAVIDLVGDLAGKTVLDFGCGDAALAERMAEKGATRVVAVDNNPRMVEAARRRLAKAEGSAAANVVMVLEGDENVVASLDRFDLVVCSLVLMMIPDWERVCTIVRTLVSAMREEGSLVLAVTHPCFRTEKHSTFYNVVPAGFSYWASGTPYEVHMHDGPGVPEVVVTDYHWTLRDYMQAVRNFGVHVAAGLEIGTIRAPGGEFVDRPAYLVWRAVRCR